MSIEDRLESMREAMGNALACFALGEIPEGIDYIRHALEDDEGA